MRSNALEDLRLLESLNAAAKIPSREHTLRQQESIRIANHRLSIELEELVQQLESEAGLAVVIKMLESTGIKVQKVIMESLRQNNDCSGKAIVGVLKRLRESTVKIIRKSSNDLQE
jgi:uncharacterized ferritin-like protein (DUF455 family)